MGYLLLCMVKDFTGLAFIAPDMGHPVPDSCYLGRACPCAPFLFFYDDTDRCMFALFPEERPSGKNNLSGMALIFTGRFYDICLFHMGLFQADHTGQLHFTSHVTGYRYRIPECNLLLCPNKLSVEVVYFRGNRYPLRFGTALYTDEKRNAEE